MESSNTEIAVLLSGKLLKSTLNQMNLFYFVSSCAYFSLSTILPYNTLHAHYMANSMANFDYMVKEVKTKQ